MTPFAAVWNCTQHGLSSEKNPTESYRRIPIFPTSEGNENRIEMMGVFRGVGDRITVFDGGDETTFDSSYRGFEKLRFHVLLSSGKFTEKRFPSLGNDKKKDRNEKILMKNSISF